MRRGFDPRSDSSSRMYQALEYRYAQCTLPEPSCALLERITAASACPLDLMAISCACRGDERSASETADAPAAPSVEDVTAFAALPTGDCILQLCDLKDDHIQALIEKPAQLPSCSIKTGPPITAPLRSGLSDRSMLLLAQRKSFLWSFFAHQSFADICKVLILDRGIFWQDGSQQKYGMSYDRG